MFLFADIAGFTALTEAHGDEEAVRLVADFTDAVKAELPAGGEHVKTIGDAVMLRIPDPADAILLGLRIVGLLSGHTAPAARVSAAATPRRGSPDRARSSARARPRGRLLLAARAPGAPRHP